VSAPPLPEICDAVLLSDEQIADRVTELGAMLTNDYADRQLRLVTVLRGGVVFLADLVRAIDLPLHIDFMAVSPYTPGAGGVVRVTKDLDEDLEGTAVVLVEDVIDTGLTVNYVLRLLKARNPASLDVCALLDKDVRRIADVPIAYLGFKIPDRFVVGYGLDLRGRYRNLPYLATLREDTPGSA
jgi:hypoxanthine phosphoribosyltransferase